MILHQLIGILNYKIFEIKIFFWNLILKTEYHINTQIS